MKSVDAAPRLRLRRAEDLIEAVPYLLGFHPRDSVVLVGLAPQPGSAPPDVPGGIGRVQITARMDIADLAGPAADDASDAFAAGAAGALDRAGARMVVGLVFAGPAIDAGQVVQAMTRAGRACERAGVTMLDWLFVTAAPQGQAVPALGWDEPTTDPPDSGTPAGNREPRVTDAGTGMTMAAGCGVVAAEATYAGLVAWPDRAALTRLLEPDPDEHRARLLAALHLARAERGADNRNDQQQWHRTAVRRLFTASRSSVQPRAAGLTDIDLVRLGVALTDIDVRDACWLAMERGRLDGDVLWRELGRRLPGPYDAAPLFLFAWQRWRAGDGVLAGIAVRRSLDSDPGYRAAYLLDSALRNGLDPFRTPRLRKTA